MVDLYKEYKELLKMRENNSKPSIPIRQDRTILNSIGLTLCNKCHIITKYYYKSRPTECRQCGDERTRDYYKKNSSSIIARNSRIRLEKYYDCEVYRFICKKRKLLRYYLFGGGSKHRKIAHVEATANDLKKYLEKLFQPDMTWKNYGLGRGKWCIDHIIPLSSANSVSEVKLLLHYTNLQPLWFVDNASKGNKLPTSE